MQPTDLRPGTLLRLGTAASVQFSAGNDILFRLIKVDSVSSYDDWTWLSGYQINEKGEAVERRTVFVRRTGLRLADPAT